MNGILFNHSSNVFKRLPPIPTKTSGSPPGKYFYNKLYHTLFCPHFSLLYNLMFSVIQHHTLWGRFFFFYFLIMAWTQMMRWSRWLCPHNCFHKASSGNFLSVYCLKCWVIAALSVFTVVEMIPALLTEPSGLQPSANQPSANQPLVSTQIVSVFSAWPASNKLKLPSLLSPSAGKKKKTAQTECAWFISNVLYLSEFLALLHCIQFACKKLNTVCLLTGLT